MMMMVMIGTRHLIYTLRRTLALPLVLWLILMTSHPSSSCWPDDDPFQPVTQDETVSVGGTVTLTCSVKENDNSSLQWSNTAQQTLYFGEKRGEFVGLKEQYGQKSNSRVLDSQTTR